jgi:multidrug efflux system outer membrane protein
MSRNVFRRAFPPLAVALALSGCSLAPKYERPAAPVAGQYPAYPGLPAGNSTAGAKASEAKVAADLGWRQFFRDPELRNLIAMSLANNRDMRVAVEKVEAARAQYGITQSDRWPTIGLGAQGSIVRYPASIRPGGSDAPSVSRSYQAGIGMTAFELDFFGRVKNLSEAAYQQYLATDEARRSVHINLVAQVAEAYFRLRAAQEQYKLVQKTLESDQKSYDLVKSRYDTGVASALDLNQAESQLNSAQADLQSTMRGEEQARNALLLLVGTPALPDLSRAAPFDRDQLVSAVPVGLPSQLLERRPDIVGAEDQLLAANADVGAARAAFFPNISITGLLGFASNQLTGLFGSQNNYWSLSPSIQIPFMSGAVINNLALAKANKKIAVAQYEKSVQTAFREVSDALAGEATYARQLDALRALQKTSFATLDLARLRYSTGVDSFLQVQTAEISLYTVQSNLLQTGLNSLLNRVDLYAALGGGWLADSAGDETPTGPAGGSPVKPAPQAPARPASDAS